MARKPLDDIRTMNTLFPRAEAIAHEMGESEPAAEHLLLAALELPDGSARRAFEGVGADPDRFRTALEEHHGAALRAVGVESPELGSKIPPVRPSRFSQHRHRTEVVSQHREAHSHGEVVAARGVVRSRCRRDDPRDGSRRAAADGGGLRSVGGGGPGRDPAIGFSGWCLVNRYLAYTRGLAEATPDTRNRIVDFWRVVAILVVMFGHWLAASIWLQPNDDIALLNSLEWIPYAAWITWLVQVMPVFFLAGGYANARALRKVAAGEELRRDWVTARMRRLFTPVIPLLLVWVGLILVLRTFVPSDVVYAGAMSATVPVWFLAVYLSLTALAPFTYAWWRRSGVVTILALAVAAIAVDVARFAFDVPGIGWVNFLFVWATVHQIGYWWSSRDESGGVRDALGWPIAGAALAVLIAVTWVGWYPVAMVGVPGAGITNMTPPTFAIALLGLVQFGVIVGTQSAVRHRMARLESWHKVIAFSGVIMTVYLWHLSAMSLVAAGGLFAFDGRAFRIEPGTTQWWLTRPVWLGILLVATLGLVAIFARFEWRISSAPMPRSRTVVIAGVLLVAGSAAAVAQFGITTRDAVVQWSVPAAALAGGALLGAFPTRRRRP